MKRYFSDAERKNTMSNVIKTAAGTVLAGLAALMLTSTAFAGDFDGGFYLAVTDDGAGGISAWGEDDFPVDVDLDTDSARVSVHLNDGQDIYEFNRRSVANQYTAESGAVLDVYDCDNLRLTTDDGIGYITR